MQEKVLITGGSGLVGSHLTQLLQSENFEVSHLSHSDNQSEIKVYQWDYEKELIDEEALQGVQYIIHLAGASVAEKKWSKERKKIIRESRVKTAELLFRKISELDKKPSAFISASAIGYYGYDSGSVEKKEGSRFGDDFLATVVKEWEGVADLFEGIGIRTVKIRTGMVLDSSQGALPKIAKPIKRGFGAALGSGEQYISWIHILDMARIFLKCIRDDNMEGVYNGVAPNPVTNKEFTKAVAKTLNKPLFLPNVPSFVLKMMLGELASIVLGGNKVSSEKIREAGFQFEYDQLEPALEDLLK